MAPAAHRNVGLMSRRTWLQAVLLAALLAGPPVAHAQAEPAATVVERAHARAGQRVAALRPADFATLAEFGARGNGQVDDGPAIRRALASGRPLRIAAGTYQVDVDPASALREASGLRYAWSIRIPSHAVLVVEPGATIRQADGAQAWTRTVSFQGASDVLVLGMLRVDANAAGRGPATNEHMHGVFFFNTRHSYVQAIESVNARGDNVFIGGSDEREFSEDLVIGHIGARTAGRKNLVLHFADVVVGSAELDNRAGGASLYGGVPDSTDRHSLDVEPDDFRAQRRFLQRLGMVHTQGSGNDFTAGTQPQHAERFIVDIDTLRSDITPASQPVAAWEQNAITVRCKRLEITGIDGSDAAVKLAYAARLEVDTMRVWGRTRSAEGFLLQMAMTGTPPQWPTLSARSLTLQATRGGGMDVRTSALRVGMLDLQTEGTAVRFAENAALQSQVQPQRIDRLVTRNSGRAAVVELSTYWGALPDIHIGRHVAIDERPQTVPTVYRVGPGLQGGLHLAQSVNPQRLAGLDDLAQTPLVDDRP
jgi:hypothetical protein